MDYGREYKEKVVIQHWIHTTVSSVGSKSSILSTSRNSRVSLLHFLRVKRDSIKTLGHPYKKSSHDPMTGSRN